MDEQERIQLDEFVNHAASIFASKLILFLKASGVSVNERYANWDVLKENIEHSGVLLLTEYREFAALLENARNQPPHISMMPDAEDNHFVPKKK